MCDPQVLLLTDPVALLRVIFKLYRRFRLPLLPQALPGRGYRQRPSDQEARCSGLIRCMTNGTRRHSWQRQSAWTAIMIVGAVTFFSSFRSSDLSQSI